MFIEYSLIKPSFINCSICHRSVSLQGGIVKYELAVCVKCSKKYFKNDFI